MSIFCNTNCSIVLSLGHFLRAFIHWKFHIVSAGKECGTRHSNLPVYVVWTLWLLKKWWHKERTFATHLGYLDEGLKTPIASKTTRKNCRVVVSLVRVLRDAVMRGWGGVFSLQRRRFINNVIFWEWNTVSHWFFLVRLSVR